MPLTRRPTPTDTPTPTIGRFTTHENCPCGSRYTSSFNRDPVVWAAWTDVHRQHGFQEEND